MAKLLFLTIILCPSLSYSLSVNLIYPAHKQVGPHIWWDPVSLIWEDSDLSNPADYYILQVSRDGVFYWVTMNTVVYGNSFILDNNYKHRQYWRVQPVKDGAYGDMSPAWYFDSTNPKGYGDDIIWHNGPADPDCYAEIPQQVKGMVTTAPTCYGTLNDRYSYHDKYTSYYSGFCSSETISYTNQSYIVYPSTPGCSDDSRFGGDPLPGICCHPSFGSPCTEGAKTISCEQALINMMDDLHPVEQPYQYPTYYRSSNKIHIGDVWYRDPGGSGYMFFYRLFADDYCIGDQLSYKKLDYTVKAGDDLDDSYYLYHTWRGVTERLFTGGELYRAFPELDENYNGPRF